MKRTRDKTTKTFPDLDAKKLFRPLGLVVLVVIGIELIIAVVHLCSALDHNHNLSEYNARVAEFNALPLEARQAVEQFGTSTDFTGGIDPDTYLVAERQAQSLFFLRDLYGPDYLQHMPLIIFRHLALFSACLFGSYGFKRDRYYYLYALPYHQAYGWLLFFCMFAGWPCMLVSYLCMRVQRSEHYRALRAERQAKRAVRRSLNAQERAEVRRLADNELAEIARGLTQPQNPELAHRTFIKYVTRRQSIAYEARLKEAENDVLYAEQMLRETGIRVCSVQRDLGEARAKYNQLKQSELANLSPARAEADWTAIQHARGVSDITYDKKHSRLEILIKVRVPYEGELYDFGDYLFCCNGGSRKFTCREVRSGVKLNAANTRPHYHINGKQYCFGSSLHAIQDYLRDGRYVEAITLVVECLHTVNQGDEQYIPDCFRKVSTVEQAKRRLGRRHRPSKSLGRS